MKLVVTQLRMELTTLVRNYEQLLLVVAIPIGVLVFFGNVDVLPLDTGLDRLVASVLALSLMSTAMVSTGIATGFDRSYNVLKRLGATPLGRDRLVWAKAGSVAVVELAQLVMLVIIAVMIGWNPRNVSWVGVVAAMVLGTAAFAGIGLALAGRLRAEVNLAAQNALYLVLLAVGGIIVPVGELPDRLQGPVRLLPSGALAEVLHASLSATTIEGSVTVLGSTQNAWLVLVVWAVATPIVAARLFRFDG